MTEPAILFFDIETIPIIFAGWRLGKTELRYDQVLKRAQVMCISWAWGDGKVKHATFNLDTYDWSQKDDSSDFELISQFSDEFQKATLVVGHNAKKFDIAFLRSRLVKYQLPDFQPVLVDDTYLSTKDIGFMSHKLDDLGDYLGIGGKAEHGNGMEWWIDIMRGDHSTLKKMVHYCDVDVIRLREIYHRVKPYIKSSLNLSVFYGKPTNCPECGSDRIVKRGFLYTRATKKQRYTCTDCGWWGNDGKNLLKSGHLR